MKFTATPAHVPFPLAATTLSTVFLPTPATLFPSGAPQASVAVQLEQSLSPDWLELAYLLPTCTRAGDELEVYLVNNSGPNPVSVLIFTFRLEPYDLFVALQNHRGIFKRGEMSSDLSAKGITPGMWDAIVVQKSLPIPLAPAPSTPGPQTASRVVAVTPAQTYNVV
ncbi:hypothetical protein [Pseudomonas sp. GW101-3H06]|jgi:hypothetical protein|uniref:hypothetical protein n=1 Tax=Pseudomonas sp. GW101-3H06 TaxID=2751347 RepID=UPI001A92741F|nr:hypothetical protein [Pseudomonas sp. GW101-3H06]